MKVANEIFEWLIQSGALVALVAFLWAYAKPLLTAKLRLPKLNSRVSSGRWPSR